MSLTQAEKLKLRNILGCVLVKGYMPDGQEGYVYVAMHLHEFEKALANLTEDGKFNAKDYHATVLARFPGEPSEDVQEFMRRKFGFSDENVIIQRERKKEATI